MSAVGERLVDATDASAAEYSKPVRARLALDLAMRIGDALLGSGMSANDVVVLMLRITEGYGLRKVHIDVTYTALMATHYPAPGATPLTAIRIVESRRVDYTLAQRLEGLAGEIHDGLPLGAAIRAYEGIVTAPRPYPQWLATTANAAVGAAFVSMFAAPWKVLLITFLSGCVVDRLLAKLSGSGVPAFFRQLAAAALITLVAAGVRAAAAAGVGFFAVVDPTLLVTGGITMLVAGIMIVGAAQDAIDQFNVTAAARVFEVMMRTAGIIAGIILALHFARRVGAPVALSPNPVALGSLAAQFSGAVLTCVAFSLSNYARPATIALSGAMGFVAWACFSLACVAGVGQVTASALGALAAALVSTLLIRRTSIPGFALVSAALLPLVPGLALYNGLIQIVGVLPGSGTLPHGMASLFGAVAVAFGIAAGTSFGTYLGRPMADRLRWMRSRGRRRTRPPSVSESSSNIALTNDC